MFPELTTADVNTVVREVAAVVAEPALAQTA
jgi:hypothetical protein